MPFSPIDILLGLLVPGLAGAIVFLAMGRGSGERYAATIALLVGFWLGIRLLELIPWVPASHWHWLPYAGLLAVAVGPMAVVEDVRLWERVLLFSTVVSVAAWLLVPDWKELDPSRKVYLVSWGVYTVGVALLLESLADRLAGSTLALTLTASLFAGAIVLALSGSLRFAQVAGAAGAAMSGCLLGVYFHPRVRTVTGVALAYAILLCGLMLIGRVQSFSNVPLVSYVLVPLAPLTLWLSLRGPLVAAMRRRRWLVVVPPGAVLITAIGLAVIAGD